MKDEGLLRMQRDAIRRVREMQKRARSAVEEPPAAKEDVLPFIRNPASLDVWSASFFQTITALDQHEFQHYILSSILSKYSLRDILFPVDNVIAF